MNTFSKYLLHSTFCYLTVLLLASIVRQGLYKEIYSYTHWEFHAFGCGLASLLHCDLKKPIRFRLSSRLTSLWPCIVCYSSSYALPLARHFWFVLAGDEYVWVPPFSFGTASLCRILCGASLLSTRYPFQVALSMRVSVSWHHASTDSFYYCSCTITL